MNAKKVKSLARVYNTGFLRIDLHPKRSEYLLKSGEVELGPPFTRDDHVISVSDEVSIAFAMVILPLSPFGVQDVQENIRQ